VLQVVVDRPHQYHQPIGNRTIILRFSAHARTSRASGSCRHQPHPQGPDPVRQGLHCVLDGRKLLVPTDQRPWRMYDRIVLLWPYPTQVRGRWPPQDLSTALLMPDRRYCARLSSSQDRGQRIGQPALHIRGAAHGGVEERATADTRTRCR
jgi:hypothetical protein